MAAGAERKQEEVGNGVMDRCIRSIRVLLFVAALAVVAFSVAGESRPALASHTEVFITKTTAAPVAATYIVLPPGGAPVTYYVWAKNIDDPHGMASFTVDLKFNPNYINITSITENRTFLQQTGRAATCLIPTIEPVPGDPVFWHANVSCITIGPPPPPGVQGSGLLATFVLQPVLGASYGFTPLTNSGHMSDTGKSSPGIIDPSEVTVQRISATIQVAKCGDVTGDGSVSGLDMFGILSKFNTSQGQPGWQAKYDLNSDGSVSGSDLFLDLGQFNLQCTQTP